MNKPKIVVRYLAVDGYSATRRFATLAGARKYAQERVGEHPEFYDRSWYAVSFDGVGRVTVEGATLAEIFPPKVEEPPANLVYDQVEGWVEVGTPQQINERDAALEWEADQRVDPNPVYEDAPCPSRGPTHDTPESLSADGGLNLDDPAECDGCGQSFPGHALSPESDHPNAPWKCQDCSTECPF